MTTVADLAGRGFLPRELPPPFTSQSYGALLSTGWRPTRGQGASTQCVKHNLFRWGSLRRELSIPNPLSYALLGSEIEANWNAMTPVFRLSPWGLTRPTRSRARAVVPRKSLRILLVAKAAVRSGARYLLRADVNRFYHSIYTHTIEWAVHTKALVKANRALPARNRQNLWARALDDRLRDLQDKQSVGIPIGPDASLVMAELLLSRVDDGLARRITSRGVRYIDDYEFSFRTLAEAESGLAALQECLAEYELALNPSKTQIRELPEPLEPAWTRELRRVGVRGRGAGQRLDLVDAFDYAFSHRQSEAAAHALRYVMGIIRHKVCLRNNWSILQALLLQAMVIEPGIIRDVLAEFVRYSGLGYPLDRPAIGDALSAIAVRHAPLMHGSEIAWVVWSHMQLNIPIADPALRAIEGMPDPVVALLTLDAGVRGLTARALNVQAWAGYATAVDLLGPYWLLAYEGARKGWLPPIPGPTLVGADPDFQAMHAAGVEFYDATINPAAAQVNVGVGVGGGYP